MGKNITMKTIIATITFTAAALVAFAQPPAKSDMPEDTLSGTRTSRMDSTGSYQATSVPSDSSNYKQQGTLPAEPKKYKQVTSTSTSTKKSTKHSSASTKSKK